MAQAKFIKIVNTHTHKKIILEIFSLLQAFRQQLISTDWIALIKKKIN